MVDKIQNTIKLTQYSHGAGCGCKISPGVLDLILGQVTHPAIPFKQLIVGNAERDDAAVMDLGDGTAIISTTDFFMPIVDDPETFGRIAATNAISDVYAMGGSPLMAIAILGWPVNVLDPAIAGMIVQGAQKTCLEAGIPLAGGHSIDSPEPIFGLAVTGRVDVKHIKKNGGAAPGDILFLTKPLGVGILSTAQKKNLLQAEHEHLSIEVMTRLNNIGERLGKMNGVKAMTDVTGFGLGGHLIEMCQASHTSAELNFQNLPVIDPVVFDYIDQGAIPGGTNRNFESYGKDLNLDDPSYKSIVCDPQTSGGLLVAVDPGSLTEVQQLIRNENLWSQSIGHMVEKNSHWVTVY